MSTVRRKKRGAKELINEMKEKYGDVVSLIQDTDRKSLSRTLYKPEHNRVVFWLALANLTEVEIANVLGVALPTIAVWKQTRPDFVAAMQAGRMEAVGKAAHSLFQVANGFSHEAEKLIPNRIKEYDPDTGKVVKEYTEVLRVSYTKQYPPNVQALLKFLAAKHPEVWGDRSEVVHTNNVNHTVDATKLSKKKLKLLRSIAQSSAGTAESEKKATAPEPELVKEVKGTKTKKKKKK